MKKATEKNQSKRYQSAYEFRIALDNPAKTRVSINWTALNFVLLAIAGLGLGILLNYLL